MKTRRHTESLRTPRRLGQVSLLATLTLVLVLSSQPDSSTANQEVAPLSPATRAPEPASEAPDGQTGEGTAEPEQEVSKNANGSEVTRPALSPTTAARKNTAPSDENHTSGDKGPEPAVDTTVPDTPGGRRDEIFEELSGDAPEYTDAEQSQPGDATSTAAHEKAVKAPAAAAGKPGAETEQRVDSEGTATEAPAPEAPTGRHEAAAEQPSADAPKPSGPGEGEPSDTASTAARTETPEAPAPEARAPEIKSESLPEPAPERKRAETTAGVPAPATPEGRRDEMFKELKDEAPENLGTRDTELSDSAPAPGPGSEEPAAPPDAQSPDTKRADSADAEQKEQPGFEIWWDQGVRMRGRDKRFQLKIGGRLMLDAAHIGGDESIESSFDTGSFGGIRQARIDFTGTFSTWLYSKISVDLTGKSETGINRNEYIKYLYLGVVGPSWLGRVEAGIMKEPISMSVLASALNLDFMERALPVVFAPSFNPGVLIRNETSNRRLLWTFGVFRYTGVDDASTDRIDVTGRIAGTPWLAENRDAFLHLGAAYSLQLGDSTEYQFESRPETSFGDKWVSTGQFPVDRGHLLGLEVAGLWRRVTFQSELLMNWAQRDRARTLNFWGAYAQLSYFLTGEQRRYLPRQGVFGRVALNHPVNFEKRTWGAWEIALRYSYLDLNDRDVRGGIIHDVSAGVNWYILRNLRLMFNYVHSHINGVGAGDIVSGRFQVDY